MSDLALSPPRLNTPDAVNHLLTRHGIRVTEKTLKTWASRGGGPEFQKSGPHRLYPVERLDIWASQRLTPIVSKTSELTSLLTFGRDPVQGPARVGVGSARARPTTLPDIHDAALDKPTAALKGFRKSALTET